MTYDHDEIVSAYIDGQASPDEIALVESDPALAADARALGAVADELRQVHPVAPPEVRSTHLRAAMDAFDQLHQGAGGPTVVSEPSPGVGTSPDRDPAVTADGAPVIDLSARRRPRGLPAWLGAAAAVVLVAGGASMALRAQSGSDDSSETASVGVEADAADAADLATEESAEDGEASADLTRAAQAGPAEDEGLEPMTSTTGFSGDEEGAGSDEATFGRTTQAAAESGGGFLPQERLAEARVSLDQLPPPDELVRIAREALLVPDLATCTATAHSTDGGNPGSPSDEVVGFRPGDVDGIEIEIILFEGPEGARALAYALPADAEDTTGCPVLPFPTP